MANEDDELTELRRKKMEQLQAQQVQAAAHEEERARVESQIQAVLRQILTPEARERLGNLKIARPDQVSLVEQQLVALAQSGRLTGRITDEMLKQILTQLLPKKKEIKIERR